MICNLDIAIIHDGKVPTHWEQRVIVRLYKDDSDALDRGKYRGLTLIN